MSYEDEDDIDETFTFPAVITAVTDRAVKVLHEEMNEEQWVPKSCIPDGDQYTEANVEECHDTFEIAAWKAKELGWEE